MKRRIFRNIKKVLQEISKIRWVVILKRSSSLIQYWAYIFTILGSAIIILGYFNRLGILPISSNSQGSSFLIFGITGIIFLMVGLIIFITSIHRENKGMKLRSTGLKVQGVVTKVTQMKYIKWRKQSPYTIHFYYRRYGFKYEGKSFLLWNRPGIAEGEKIEVYINDEKREDCYIDV